MQYLYVLRTEKNEKNNAPNVKLERERERERERESTLKGKA